MTKQEFLQRLEQLLADLPYEERDSAMTYYREYLEEAGPENEQAVLAELGSPEQLSAQIHATAGAPMTRRSWSPPPRPGSRKTERILVVVLIALVAVPILLGVLGGVFGFAFGGIALVVAGLVCTVISLFQIASAGMDALLLTGVSLAVLGLGIVWTGGMWVLLRAGFDWMRRGFVKLERWINE